MTLANFLDSVPFQSPTRLTRLKTPRLSNKDYRDQELIMAGHSKWANIQHRKKAQDQKKGKLFTLLIREITVAARLEANRHTNPRLRWAIEKALSANIAKERIERAIQRAQGKGTSAEVIKINYEGYAPHGIALIIACITENRNRTVADLRYIFNRFGGSLTTNGSVSHLFESKGLITLEKIEKEEDVFDIALQIGVVDIHFFPNNTALITTTPKALFQTKSDLQNLGLACTGCEISIQPINLIELTDEQTKSVRKVIHGLENIGDVQNVCSNASLHHSHTT